MNAAKSVGEFIFIAAFNTFNGIVISGFLMYIISGILAVIGIGLSIISEKVGIKVDGISLIFAMAATLMSICAIVLMFLGRYLTLDTGEHIVSEDISLLFMAYGMLIVLTVVQIYLYNQNFDGLFREGDIDLYRIIKYVMQITLLGFIPDALYLHHVELNLHAQGIMIYCEYILKIIMAVTVISGAYRHLEAKYRIATPF